MSETRSPDPVFASATREAAVVASVWLGALVYTIGVCGWLGYDQCEGCVVPTVLGFPRWVFWGIVVPWVICVAITTWFALAYMTDDPLGTDDEGEEPLPGAPPESYSPNLAPSHAPSRAPDPPSPRGRADE